MSTNFEFHQTNFSKDIRGGRKVGRGRCVGQARGPRLVLLRTTSDKFFSIISTIILGVCWFLFICRFSYYHCQGHAQLAFTQSMDFQ